MSFNRFNILGVSISAVNMEQTIDGAIDNWIKNDHRDYIVLTGVHGVIEMQKDDVLKKINNNSGLTTPDGMRSCDFFLYILYTRINQRW